MSETDFVDSTSATLLIALTLAPTSGSCTNTTSPSASVLQCDPLVLFRVPKLIGELHALLSSRPKDRQIVGGHRTAVRSEARRVSGETRGRRRRLCEAKEEAIPSFRRPNR